MQTTVPAARLRHLNSKPQRSGGYVLYWMQSTQRVAENWAYTYAVETANRQKLPLAVFFGLTPEFPEANMRHYMFMLEGLKEAADELETAKVKFAVQIANPSEGAVELSKNAACVVTDRGYLRINREWYKTAAQMMDVALVQVEDNVVVPVEEASPKEEYSAATLRAKLLPKIPMFLELPPKVAPEKSSLDLPLRSVSLANLQKTVETLKIDGSVAPSAVFHGGTQHAKQLLKDFLKNGLAAYGGGGPTPDYDCASNLSPYLHFGQISPVYIAVEVLKAHASVHHRFLEELIVRRELAVNFVHYNKNYDTPLCLPMWAQKTLEAHTADPRPYLYSRDELETAETHDPYWNAAQNEMAAAGKMNGYMRMYWGKKILEWTKTPQEAYEIALYLNNKYELDGRDPNGYAGVAWCFGKHDRPWAERSVFGVVRYMNSAGLERKFRMPRYLAAVGSKLSS